MYTKVKGANSTMSNFYPCSITIRNTTYPSAEHYYQYRKAVHHNKISLSRRILKAPTANDAKFLSKSIRPNPSWQKNRIPFVTDLLQHKFDQVPEFRTDLLNTTGFIDHPVPIPDAFWGSHNEGANNFGLALSTLRNNYQRPATQTCLD